MRRKLHAPRFLTGPRSRSAPVGSPLAWALPSGPLCDRSPRRFDLVPLDPSPSTGTNVTSQRRPFSDRVLPEVPVRQWVLTLPYPLRYRCAWNARLTSEVLQSFLRAVFADQRRRARKLLGIRKGSCGSVTFIRRFGSALNLTPHYRPGRALAAGDRTLFGGRWNPGRDFG